MKSSQADGAKQLSMAVASYVVKKLIVEHEDKDPKITEKLNKTLRDIRKKKVETSIEKTNYTAVKIKKRSGQFNKEESLMDDFMRE